MTATRIDAILAHIEQNAAEHRDQLFDFLRIESVSADPKRRGDMVAAANWLQAEMRRIGISSEIVETSGHPIVFGNVEAGRGLLTVLVYGHYDVQPEDPLDEWQTPPFEPDVRDGAIYARGSTDDKGQLFMYLKAVEGYLATGDLPINVRFVFEGEEEIGSASLARLLDTNQERLTADLALVSDSPMFDRGVPSVGYGLRGLCYVEVRLEGPSHDLHSGQFGGTVENPANVLAEILAEMHDNDGRVAVPGFYDMVRPIDAAERDAVQRLPFDEERLLSQIGAPALGGETDYSALERLWLRPTLDVNGLTSGYQGPGAKTIVPARATAKVSCRLVPDQDHLVIARLVGEHIRSLAPPGVQVEVEFIHGALPWVTAPSTPAFAAASAALESAFGVQPVYQRDGGTIPIVPLLARALGMETMLLGFGVPDENKHGPNEHLLLSNYEMGVEAIVRLLAELARLDKGKRD